MHPGVIFNPPGRNIIEYRVGNYASFRHALLQSSAEEIELSITVNNITPPIWHPGAHGDLAVQTVEWWAYLADILTFYNERIATQAYLRTADLPESVNRLVRLLGYRPRPGIGAKGVLAALASSSLPFTLPAGFAVQSKPGPGKQPQVFELETDATIGIKPTSPASLKTSSGAVSVQPVHDSTQPPIQEGTTTIVLKGAPPAVKKDDMVLILPKNQIRPAAFAVANVAAVRPGNDASIGAITRIELNWKSRIDALDSVPDLQLYKGGQLTQVWQYPASDGKVIRNVNQAGTIDLASLVRGFKSNDPIVIQASAADFRLFAVKSATEAVWYANPDKYDPPDPVGTNVDPSVPPDPDKHIAIPIPHTSLTLAEKLPDELVTDRQADRANFFVWHSWTEAGDLIVLPPPTVDETIVPPGSAVVLEPSFGAAFPDVPAGTKVLVEDAVGNGASGMINSDGKLVLDSPVPLLIPPLRAYFNLLSVSRGKTVTREVLGSGNAAIPGQDFVLQNSPVTYLQPEDSRSGDNYSSSVRVWVNDVEWTEVQSFFGQPSNAQVFITHEDDQGKTHVIFGDGEFGTRLPTGVNNIVASYRYGSGADTPAPGTLTVVLKPQPGLQSIRNPVAVGGGSDPDPPAKLRRLAPRSVLTFNRAVSADDYEAIASQALGVTRAKAGLVFDFLEQRPRVTVWVGDDAEAVKAARVAIAAAADPNRFPAVLLAKGVQVSLTISLVIDPRRNDKSVLDAVRVALLDPDKGLLGLNVLEIGQPIYDSQLYAACVAVPGVLAVKRLEFSSAESPKQLDFTVARARQQTTLSLQTSRKSNFSSSATGKRIRRPSNSNTCMEHRHDPGAGAFFILPNEGLTLSLEAR
ncbi:putative baseplate assembly protein [Nitrosospira multiformis]|uniref:Putative baseplate assembly protein n=1 Tax=Nitrosospira multiformis TaxID=1231 RepID=A0A1H8LEZ7_9PROT|nr:putative baseplate assembly protein [Nitrosospira multiformis]